MDAAAITTLVMDIINNPLSPVVGTAIVTKASEDIYEKAKEQGRRLLDAIQNRFAKEPDGGKANKALQNFVEEPEDYAVVLESKLLNILEADPAFCEELEKIIQDGPKMLLTIEEEAKASRIRMNNSIGHGHQEIRGGKKSVIEDVEMNIN